MNYIYCTHIKGLNWSQLQFQRKILVNEDVHGIDNLKFGQDKCRSLLGKMLLLYILKRHENYQGNTLPKLSYNTYQKPKINFIQGNFNISHAKDWVVCAYAEKGEIGIDIEQQTPINLNDYKAVMTQNEYDRARQSKNFNFFQLWTLKEAIMKAEGSGFFLSPTSFELPYPFINNDSLLINNKQWFLYTQSFSQNYTMSVASSNTLKDQLTSTLISANKLLV